MKSDLKAYRACTYRTYRIVIFFLYPLVLLLYRLLSIAVMKTNADSPEEACFLLFVLFETIGFLIVYLFETVSDIFLFPGVYAKEGGFPAILRTSRMGESVATGMLKGNALRSILMAVLQFVGAFIELELLFVQAEVEKKFLIVALGILAVTLASVQACILWVRFFTTYFLMGLPLMVVMFVAVAAISGLSAFAYFGYETEGPMLTLIICAIQITFFVLEGVNIRVSGKVHAAGFAAREEK